MKIRYERDCDCENPRKDRDNFGKMICFHGRYDLGDAHALRTEDFAGWAEMREYISRELEAVVVLPLYLMDHSGISISVGDFGDPWDSGQVGFIYCTKQDILENWMGTELSPKLLEQAKALLAAEVREYDLYLQGDCWGYVIEAEDGSHLDSCWGYIGRDDVEQAAGEALDYLRQQAEAARWKRIDQGEC